MIQSGAEVGGHGHEKKGHRCPRHGHERGHGHVILENRDMAVDMVMDMNFSIKRGHGHGHVHDKYEWW